MEVEGEVLLVKIAVAEGMLTVRLAYGARAVSSCVHRMTAGGQATPVKGATPATLG